MSTFSPLTPPPPHLKISFSSNATDIIPENQESTDEKSENKKEKLEAQNLLFILKNLEKKNHQISARDSRAYSKEALSILSALQLRISRGGGLFGGEASRAESLLATSTIAGEATNSNSHSAKQKKRGGMVKGLMDINAIRRAIFTVDTMETGVKMKSLCEENLWLASLGRVLGVGKNKKDNTNEDGTEALKIPFAIVEVAASCITAICEHSKQNLMSPSSESQFCAKTELEIISMLGTQWLSCLVNKIQECLYVMDPKATYFGIKPSNAQNSAIHISHDIQTAAASASASASACLKAAASIITLLGTRLSRSTKLVSDLHSVAWAALGSAPYMSDSEFLSDPEIVSCASSLAAALPLTGNTGVPQSHVTNDSILSGSSSPPKLWTRALRNAANALSILLRAAFRYRNTTFFSSKADETEADSDSWLQNIRSSVPSQSERMNAVLIRVEGLKSLIISLLNMEGYVSNNANVEIFLKCSLPLKLLFQTCELLIKFGQGAESRYLSAKNQTVRDDVAENGLILSSKSIIYLANPVRCAGYELLQCVMTIAGSSATGSLLTIGNSLTDLIYYGISTSSSIGVQRHFHRLPSKRQQQWLNQSAILRMKSFDTMKIGCLLLGSACSTSSVMGKSAVMVAACLLEQINCHRIGVHEKQWSTSGEQVSLAGKAANAISAYISVGGGHIHSTIRSTLESTISSCLSSFIPSQNKQFQKNEHLVLQATSLKVAMLHLTTNAISVPWQDGGISTLTSKLRQVSTVLRFDRDPSVVMAALSALNLCNIILTPRSIPLSIESSRKLSDSLHGISKVFETSLPSNHQRLDRALKVEKKNESAQKRDGTSSKVKSIVLLQENHADSNEKKRVTPSKGTERIEEKAKKGFSEEIDSNNDDVLKDKSAKEDRFLGTKRKRKESEEMPTSKKVEAGDVEEEELSRGTSEIQPQNPECKDIEMNTLVNDSSKGEKLKEQPEYGTNTNEKANVSLEEDSSDESNGSFPEIIDSDPDDDDL